MKLIPQIRFKGFTDDWEERKLLDNVDKVLDYRGKSPTKFGMEWGTEGYLVLSALNVKNGYIDKSVEAKYGDQELFERWMGSNRLEKGDVLFTTEAPLGNVAQVPDDNGYILNQRAVAFKSSKDTDNNFFAQLLRSPIVQNTLNANSSGGTAKGIGMKEFAKLNAHVPKTFEEQQKIGTFFKQLDHTIALHQRKLDLLKETKKGFLQKMFPKNGAKVPEIRFPGFTEDWEEKKFKEVINSGIKGKAKAEMSGTKSLYLDTNYLNGGVVTYVDSPRDVENDDVLILWDGSQAGTVYYGFSGALGSTLKAYRAKESGAFLYQQLKRNQQIIYDRYRTPNIPHVVKTFTDEFMVSMPSSEEQFKIGTFFKQLDDTIALQQRKLDLLKETKKGFLQKMF